MKQYTDVTVLVDRSGSMASIKTEMEKAFSAFLEKHKEVPSTRVTLIQFDTSDDQDVQYTALPVRMAEPLNLRPRGGTPLLDAFCKTIDRTGRRLRDMNPNDRPDQVLFVVITDGHENASREFKRQDVYNRVGTQRDQFNWQFIYLGANQDAIAEAATFNIPQFNTMLFANENAGYAVGNALAANTVSYTNRSTTGTAAFTDDQRKKSLTNTVDSGTLITNSK